VVCLAPRAPGDSLRPRRSSDVVVRPGDPAHHWRPAPTCPARRPRPTTNPFPDRSNAWLGNALDVFNEVLPVFIRVEDSQPQYAFELLLPFRYALVTR
jgi:hypothetical protein